MIAESRKEKKVRARDKVQRLKRGRIGKQSPGRRIEAEPFSC